MRDARFWYSCLVIAICLGTVASRAFSAPGTAPVAGLREKPATLYALTKAKIVISPEETLEEATLVIEDGVIIGVSHDPAPPQATVIDCAGKTIYPGLIDAYATIELSSPRSPTLHDNSLITPQLRAVDAYHPDPKVVDKLRRQGVTARLVGAEPGIIKGVSALVATTDEATASSILVSEVAQHVRLGVSTGRGRNSYPNSPMGAVALARQTFLDAEWYGRVRSSHRHPALPFGPQVNDGLETLYRAMQSRQLFIFVTTHELNFLRADAFAREFSLHAAMRGSGDEYRRLDEVKKSGRSLLLPVNFPKAPRVDSPEAILDTELEALMHWELAPENPGRLAKAGVPIALCSFLLSNVSDFLPNVRRAVERGLDAKEALRALTITPARLFGVEPQLGTLEVGKRADFVITDGPLFEAETDILETWIDGAAYRYPLQPTHDVRGSYRLTFIDQQGEPRKTTLRLGGSARKLQGVLQFKNAEQKESEVRLLSLRLEDRQLIAKFSEKAFGGSGMAQLSLTLLIDGQATPEEQVLKVIGQVGWSNQPWSAAHGKRLSSEVPIVSEVATTGIKAGQSNDNSKTDSPVKAIARVTYPFGAHGRLELAKQESPVLIRNASLWTCGPQGIVERGSLLIEGGKIVRVVAGELEVEDGVLVIDADGKHLTPGLIDCHSHIATDGGVNESSQAITCEVRVQDFIDSDHQQIYRQLAGGVTAINILHGSANPIGGQNQVIKLRWGESPDQLRMKEAPPGVKFALGENVKQSSLSEMGTRYPQSRMGVEQILRDAFQTAREYERRWQQYQENHDLPLPRRDLELEALVEILQGKRLVHCHSYRQDEILMLLRLCDEFGIRIATLQHILEGYKVADAMARHGAAGSSFSDWWAYKIEVYDAIPFNGALMHQAGVNVSFNSDDSELARHLNHEAAKAMKYGGVSAEEALKFVTLNPAKQLRIDAHVGSLEEGKQADLVVWSGPPLSMMSRCEQTWIDGKKYFDLVEDEAMRQRESILKSQLVQKILDSGAAMKTEAAENSEKTADESWLRYDEFCQTSMSGDAR